MGGADEGEDGTGGVDDGLKAVENDGLRLDLDLFELVSRAEERQTD